MEQDLKYPIGKFDPAIKATPEGRADRIQTIRDLPSALAAAVAGLDSRALDTPYRPGGWTVRQVVHHIADSHLNAYCRFKLALTEENPAIRAYHEDRWAELPDSKMRISASLGLIGGLHERFAELLGSMSESDFRRGFNHPESGHSSLEQALALYAWHSRHHTAHITALREREGW